MGQEVLDQRGAIKESALNYFQQALRNYWRTLGKSGLDSSKHDSLAREVEFSRTILRSQDLEPFDLIAAVASALPPQDRVEILLPLMVTKFNLTEDERERFRIGFTELP